MVPDNNIHLGNKTYDEDDGKKCGRREVVISPAGGNTRSSRLIPHTLVHWEISGEYCGTSDIPPHLLDLYQVIGEDREESDDAMVGS